MDKQPFSTTIYESLRLKETSELVDIWKKNDRQAWSDEAFAAIERILDERQEAVPSQGVKTDEDEGVDTYHDPEKVIKIAEWMRWLAIALAVGWMVYLLFAFISGFISGGFELSLFNAAPIFLSTIGYLVLALLLLGGSQLLLLIMDIEMNTRSETRNQNVGK